jgi:hypothetical protein
VPEQTSSPGPVPVPPLIKSSVKSSPDTPETGQTDDFHLVIKILVEHKAREHPPRNRKRWELTTIPTTIEEDGDAIRAALAKGRTVIEAAGDILGSQAKAVVAAERLK